MADRFKTPFEECLDEKLQAIGVKFGSTVDYHQIALGAAVHQVLSPDKPYDPKTERYEQTSFSRTLIRKRALYAPFFLEFIVDYLPVKEKTELTEVDEIFSGQRITQAIAIDDVLREGLFASQYLTIKYYGESGEGASVDFGVDTTKFPSLLHVYDDRAGGVKVNMGNALLLKHSNTFGFNVWITYEDALARIRDQARYLSMDITFDHLAQFLQMHRIGA